MLFFLLKGWERLWEKDQMMLTSFSHNVSKNLHPQGSKPQMILCTHAPEDAALSSCRHRASLVNSLPRNPTFNDSVEKRTIENTVRKGENAGNQHFLRFSQSFLPSKNKFMFLIHIYIIVCNCFQFGPV